MAAMGITKPSLCSAFGDKEALFHKTLDLYEAEKLAHTRIALDQPTARAVVKYFLRGAVAVRCDSGSPKGCVIHSTAGGGEQQSIKTDVVARRASLQAA
jgi:AcrR family transcriptional regulator